MATWISLLTDKIQGANPTVAVNVQQWLWQPGMCFLDEQLWWGEQKKRIAPHEGVDLACYADQQGKIRRLDPGLLIPAIFPGRVVQLHQDFLNWSVSIRHDQFCRDETVLHTIYGHVQPKETVQIGQEVRAGEPVAVLAAYPRSTVPLHLHFTVAWVPESIPSHQLNWQMLSENKEIILLDPLKRGEWEYG
ncbi:MAG: M23 family metallopeptidase [Candidatus Electrothrix sp. AR5]|nr:M23 family metallopeptidase [Candidatus Electrothrix sp. AR5]